MEFNIFQILSSGNLELTHSAMIRLLVNLQNLQELNHNQDTLNYFFQNSIDKPFKIKLEQSFKFNKDKKNKRIRYDLLFLEKENEKNILGVIENKFKATPTRSQLEIYDTHLKEISSEKLMFKILLVFDENQVPSDVQDYVNNENDKGDEFQKDEKIKWLVVSYFGGNGILKKLENLQNEITLQNQSMSLLIQDYTNYLKLIEAEMNSIIYLEYYFSYLEAKKKTLSVLSHRELYFRYLLHIQSELSKILTNEYKMKFRSDNDGGKNNIPSIAFWFPSDNNKQIIGIKEYYFGIDGDSMKIGVCYFRKYANYLEKYLL